MMTANPQLITNAMSVDVEDYFQVSAFESTIARTDWDKLECRVEKNTQKILELFDQKNIKATFFTLYWIAQRYPGLIRDIVNAGHELASHGMEHTRVTQQSPTEFKADIVESKARLEDMSGQPVVGYRAASYSITMETYWALEILQDAGYQYSSSIYPIRHDLYGIPDAPRFAYKPFAQSDFLEIPISTLQFGNKNYPCGGGGYFRLFPYQLSRWAINRLNVKHQQSALFYFHPWEIDPDQPRQADISAKTRFRHYLNLSRMEQRLNSLASDFQWDTMQNVFLSNLDKYPQVSFSTKQTESLVA
jgi:polysaccharide deacetylase family protein (PEP-CTERM system associated)